MDAKPTAAQRLQSAPVVAVTRSLVGVFLATVCLLPSVAAGQSIAAPADAAITHDTMDNTQAFAQAVWAMSNTNALGATVHWTCGTFVHAGACQTNVDARLQVQILSSQGLANWTAVAPIDQTNVGLGDTSASVTAVSVLPGDGTAGLSVTFMETDFSSLTSGDYTLLVTGTISAN